MSDYMSKLRQNFDKSVYVHRFRRSSVPTRMWYNTKAQYREHLAELPQKNRCVRLADELKISPGIVVGHFQRLTQKWNYFNGLKRKFQWESAKTDLSK